MGEYANSNFRRRKKAHRVAPPTPEQYARWLEEENKKGAASGCFGNRNGPGSADILAQGYREARRATAENVKAEAELRASLELKFVELKAEHARLCVLANLDPTVPHYVLFDRLLEMSLDAEAVAYTAQLEAFAKEVGNEEP